MNYIVLGLITLGCLLGGGVGCSVKEENLAKTHKTNQIVNVTLVAAKGKSSFFGDRHKTDVLSYNSQVPGPEIHLNVGQTLELRLVNQLTQPTTIHWHGMELPANMDGSNLSQKPVPPGESYVYKFKVHRAGTYWYHPHFNSSEQIERGLYGALIVHDPLESQLLGADLIDETYVLDDINLNEERQINFKLPLDPLEKARVLANGREGNRILINGRYLLKKKIEIGRPMRMRFINAANSRFFRLSWGESQKSLYKIGDDLGLISKVKRISAVPMITDEERGVSFSDPDISKGLTIIPGERAEVYWVPQGQVGESVILEWHDQVRGRHFFKQQTDSSRLDVIADAGDGRMASVPMVIFELVKSRSKIGSEQKVNLSTKLNEELILSVADINVKKPIQFKFGHDLPFADGTIRFFAQATMINGQMVGLSFDDLKSDYLDHVPTVHLGDVRVVEVYNYTRSIHPFHLHGFPFVPLEVEYFKKGQSQGIDKFSEKVWKDTIAVPSRKGFRRSSWSVLRLLVPFRAKGAAAEWVAHSGKYKNSRSGGWMAHCHILEHAASGMASWINVLPQN